MPLGLPAFPSPAGGATTETVGFFDATPVELADWFSSGDGALGQQRPGWKGLPDVIRDLAATDLVTARAFVPLGRWTLLLTNGPSGTDLGVLPSQATRGLGCLSVRAVWSDRRDASCPAVLIEVFAPDGEPPLMARRSVAVVADGERWVFESTGLPYRFEHIRRYGARRKADRFTPRMLHEYLRALHVPIDEEPDWAGAVVVTDEGATWPSSPSGWTGSAG